MAEVVIGVGNRLRGDDAVGLVVAERLQRRRGAPRVVRHDGDLFGLPDLWKGAEVAVLVDALSSPDAPGTFRRFDVRESPLPRVGFRCSTHGVGVAEAVELARVRGVLPRRLIVYGVVGARFDPGMGMTAPVERAVDEVVRRILAEVTPVGAAEPGGEDHA
jgi:hydrogenase maturation protease